MSKNWSGKIKIYNKNIKTNDFVHLKLYFIKNVVFKYNYQNRKIWNSLKINFKLIIEQQSIFIALCYKWSINATY